jgi:uncharacterized membrane protein YfcA
MLPTIPDGVSPLLFYVCISAAVLIIGIAKAGFGGGIGILAVPLTLIVQPPREGLGFMLPLLILGDIFSVMHHRGNESRTHLRWLVVGGTVGVVLATLFLFGVQWAAIELHVNSPTQRINQALNLVVGIACALMVLAQVYRLVGFPLPHIPPTPLAGRTTGLVAGFISTLAHSAGPLVNVYLLEQGLNKTKQTGTAVVYFLLVNCIKVPFLILLAYITWRTFTDALVFMPIIPVGTVMGYWMHKRVPERPFAVIMYVGAAAGAAWMIYKGLQTG